MPVSLAAQGALPVQFVTGGEAVVLVHFNPTELLADETWYVGGSCKGVAEPAPVQVVDFAHLAEIEVYLSDYSYTADRRVCIVNPDAAPKAFWQAYER
ncbi:hypothetical protein [Celeribacter neptunius]|uniref:Uncharacterized protein n=1 Tax=Celeribacter neptunius TaxID=588602 RepID=A0A1I3VE83_9RHOB|nr:hypothetical protein [Celeribacter neptunius]SFJ93678.1 hypothetical protein SAMN04487991_3333 [Celeribacter neptunius]